jgi:hypothetical protein
MKTVFGHFREVEGNANAKCNHQKAIARYGGQSVGGRDWKLDNAAIWLSAQGNE